MGKPFFEKPEVNFSKGNSMYKFEQTIYDTMLTNFECWFVTRNGFAMLINDCQLLDC